MHRHYSSIYLAAHLDDAVLSCGGQIAAQTAVGQAVLVVTVMAGDPAAEAVSDYARSLHERWEAVVDAAARRRQEDLAAGALLECDMLHWSVPDCIYRSHPATGQPFYVSDADIFGAIHPLELPLIEQLASQMRRLPAHDRLCVPLTAGHHVDHQLVRRAAESAFALSTLLYYEDYPYVQQPNRLAEVIPPDSDEWQPLVIRLGETELEAKIAAIAAYRSQLSTFFQDRADLARQVQEYADRVGGERLWRRVDGVHDMPHVSR